MAMRMLNVECRVCHRTFGTEILYGHRFRAVCPSCIRREADLRADSFDQWGDARLPALDEAAAQVRDFRRDLELEMDARPGGGLDWMLVVVVTLAILLVLAVVATHPAFKEHPASRSYLPEVPYTYKE